ncbi:hypothetical protein ACOME3_002225 [Neoechinorhynchus agilis]
MNTEIQESKNLKLKKRVIIKNLIPIFALRLKTLMKLLVRRLIYHNQDCNRQIINFKSMGVINAQMNGKWAMVGNLFTTKHKGRSIAKPIQKHRLELTRPLTIAPRWSG